MDDGTGIASAVRGSELPSPLALASPVAHSLFAAGFIIHWPLPPVRPVRSQAGAWE